MEIKIDGCAVGGDVLKDMGKFKTVKEWAKTIVEAHENKEVLEFNPLYFTVKKVGKNYKKKYMNIIFDNKLNEDAIKNINKIPARQLLEDDNITINIDKYERDLIITINERNY